MKSRPAVLRSLRLRNTTLIHSLPLRPAVAAQAAPTLAIRSFTSSPRWLNTAGEGPKTDTGNTKQQQKKASPPPEDNAPPQSPWKVFVQTLREEIEKNQGWQDDVKQLKGEVDKAVDNAAMQKARAMYEKVRVSSWDLDAGRVAEWWTDG